MSSKEEKGKKKAMTEDIDRGRKPKPTAPATSKTTAIKHAQSQSHAYSKTCTLPPPSLTESIMIVMPLLKKARTKENVATGPLQPKLKLSMMDFVAVPPPSQKFARQPFTPLTPAVLTSTPSTTHQRASARRIKTYTVVEAVRLNCRSNSPCVETQEVGLQVEDIEIKVEDVSPSHGLDLTGCKGSDGIDMSRLSPLPLPLPILPPHEP
ncbi:hypothetical protein F5I97DRAFT_1827016 [Phlebopus sp. FC_14]|nr:hypothetical protein F5I97DRAFT_1827016 [Phlebopus sp. FC_14]